MLAIVRTHGWRGAGLMTTLQPSVVHVSWSAFPFSLSHIVQVLPIGGRYATDVAGFDFGDGFWFGVGRVWVFVCAGRDAGAFHVFKQHVWIVLGRFHGYGGAVAGDELRSSSSIPGSAGQVLGVQRGHFGILAVNSVAALLVVDVVQNCGAGGWGLG